MVLKKLFSGFSLDVNLVMRNGKLILKGINNSSIAAISSLVTPPSMSLSLYAASTELKLI